MKTTKKNIATLVMAMVILPSIYFAQNNTNQYVAYNANFDSSKSYKNETNTEKLETAQLPMVEMNLNSSVLKLRYPIDAFGYNVVLDIKDITGRTIKAIKIYERNTNEVNIELLDLLEGKYTYLLAIDGERKASGTIEVNE